jgi:hypothetical protein
MAGVMSLVESVTTAILMVYLPGMLEIIMVAPHMKAVCFKKLNQSAFVRFTEEGYAL